MLRACAVQFGPLHILWIQFGSKRWSRSPNKMEEDADHPAWCRLSFVEEIRRNALDRIPQVQKLRFSVSGHRTFGASKLVYRRAADLTVDDLGIVFHRELEGHSTGVVTYYSAPLERHQSLYFPASLKCEP